MTQSDERQTIWLTKEAFDKKTAELEELRGPVRADIVSRISAARDEGDLKENGGYHAAREELAKLEGRVAQFEGDDDVETLLLGAREMADDDIQVFSPQSPLGSALIGARVGDTVSYQAPNGKHLKVVIVDAGPYTP